MGPGRSGKTSIRNIIFGSYLPRDTARLGTTIELEQSQVTFLAHLTLNLWDCGGQLKYIDYYLHKQTDCIFNNVGVMIYVFDIDALTKEGGSGGGGDGGDDESHADGGGGSDEGGLDDAISERSAGIASTMFRRAYCGPTGEWTKKAVLEYFKHCVKYLNEYSPNAKIVCLLNKIDLVNKDIRDEVFNYRRKEILDYAVEECRDRMQFFGTTIWDDTLFTAWSSIVNSLIPNISFMQEHLQRIREGCGATEVAVFERSTFLCIARNTCPEYLAEVGGTSASGADDASPVAGGTGTSSGNSGVLRDPRGVPTTTKVTTLIKRVIRGLRKGVSGGLDGGGMPVLGGVAEEGDFGGAKDTGVFQSIKLTAEDFTAVIDRFTDHTYILVVSHKPHEQPVGLLEANMKAGRAAFHNWLTQSPDAVQMKDVL
jgi:Ras-related GTP-binding protein A/B